MLENARVAVSVSRIVGVFGNLFIKIEHHIYRNGYSVIAVNRHKKLKYLILYRIFKVCLESEFSCFIGDNIYLVLTLDLWYAISVNDADILIGKTDAAVSDSASYTDYLLVRKLVVGVKINRDRSGRVLTQRGDDRVLLLGDRYRDRSFLNSLECSDNSTQTLFKSHSRIFPLLR